MRVASKICVAAAVMCFGFSARADLVDAIETIVGEAVITYQQISVFVTQGEDTLRLRAHGNAAAYEKLQMNLVNDVRENLVDQKLILHEFTSAGFKIPENIIDEYVQDRIHDLFHDDRVEMTKKLQHDGMTYEDLKQQMHDDFIVNVMRQKFVPEPIISPLKVENYYLGHKDEFKVEDEAKMRLIVLNRLADDTNGAVRKRMEEIISQVKDGASFTDLAKSYSEGSQRSEGGETGWQETSKLNKVIVEGISKLKPGEYGSVLESPEAYFLVLLEERRPARIRPLTEVRADIEKTLMAQERNRLWVRWIGRLKQKTFIQNF
jgi:parvulin-like peptidyl-prolyl isomerase